MFSSSVYLSQVERSGDVVTMPASKITTLREWSMDDPSLTCINVAHGYPAFKNTNVVRSHLNWNYTLGNWSLEAFRGSNCNDLFRNCAPCERQHSGAIG